MPPIPLNPHSAPSAHGPAPWADTPMPWHIRVWDACLVELRYWGIG